MARATGGARGAVASGDEEHRNRRQFCNTYLATGAQRVACGENSHETDGALRSVAARATESSTLDERSANWVRWLAWTVLFGMVVAASGLAYRSWAPGIPPAWSLAFLVPPLVAAFVIGACFRSWRWAVVPPVAMIVAGTPLLLIPYQVVEPHIPRLMVQDLTYVKAMTYALFIMLFGSAVLLVLLALVAAAGVRWGQRREDDDFPPHPVDPGGDASS